MGGSDVTGCDVTYVQCYDVDSGTCSIVSRMPSPARLICALPYRNYAILLGKTKAFVLNFDDVSLTSYDGTISQSYRRPTLDPI